MKIDRRSFLIRSASLGALALVPTRVTYAASVNTNLLAFADMEVSHFDDYLTPANPGWLRIERSGNKPEIASTVSRNGTRSAKVYLNRLTSSTSYRTEMNPIGNTADNLSLNMEWRKTYWIGFSIFIPADWKKNSSTSETLWQIHNYPDDWANSKSPIVAAYVNNLSGKGPEDKYKIRISYVLTPEAENPGNTGLKTAVSDQTQSIYDDLGKWTDWVIEYRPDWRLLADGGIGVTRIWRDGIQFIDYAGPNACNETKGPYLKLGCYKWDWKTTVGDTDPVVERTYFYDELRMSRPDVGSYEIVAPGGGRIARPMAPQVLVD